MNVLTRPWTIGDTAREAPGSSSGRCGRRQCFGTGVRKSQTQPNADAGEHPPHPAPVSYPGPRSTGSPLRPGPQLSPAERGRSKEPSDSGVDTPSHVREHKFPKETGFGLPEPPPLQDAQNPRRARAAPPPGKALASTAARRLPPSRRLKA